MCFKEHLGLEQRNQHEKDGLEDKKKMEIKLPFHAFKRRKLSCNIFFEVSDENALQILSTNVNQSNFFLFALN